MRHDHFELPKESHPSNGGSPQLTQKRLCRIVLLHIVRFHFRDHPIVTMNPGCKKGVTSEIGSYAVAFLGFLLFYCLCLSLELVKGNLLAPGDGIIFYYPVTRDWSLWVDNILSGYPALGDPQYILWYPLRWLGLSYNSLVISAYVLASFFTFGFVMQLTGNIWAGIFAGIVFGMSGSMTAHIGHLTIIHAAAWLPLVTWAADRLVTRASIAWFLIGSSAVACMLLAGFPQIFVYGMLVATLFFLFRLLYLNRPHGAQVLKTGGLYFGMVLLGVSLAAVQVLPLMELSDLSVRRDMSYQGFISYSLPLSHSVLLLFPNLFGDFTGGYFGRFDLSAVAFYFGWSTLFLITLALFVPHVRNMTLFWVTIACISFTFALGDATPLAKIAYHLPLVGKLRVPSRALVVTDFAAAILGGLGLANLLSGSVTRKQFLAACATFAAITLVAFAAVLIGYSALVKLAAEKGVALSKAAFANESVYLPLIFAAATMVSILIVVWRRGRASGSAMCALLIADLASSNWHGVGRGYFVDRASLRMDAQWRMVKEELRVSRGRLLLLGSALGPLTFTPGSPNLNLLHDITQASGYGPLMLKRYTDVTGIVTSGDLPTPPASPVIYQMLNVEWGMIGTQIALFGSGCGAIGPHPPVNVKIPPGFRPTKIRIVSHMGCSPEIEQATAVLQIDVNNASGTVASLSVRAGEDTAEWAIDRPDVKKVIRHTRPRVLDSFDADGIQAHWYETIVPIPATARAAPIQSLTVRGLLENAIINVRDMVLIDDESGRQLPVQLELLRVVQPPNWDETTAMTTGGGYLAKFRKSLGRAWLVGAVRRAEPQAIVRAVREGRMPDGTPFDPARLAFVEETPPDLRPRSSAQLNGRVDIISLTPGKWILDVVAPAASFLVISQTNYPGWRVSIDDKPAHLYQTNYAFQGVAVPPGHSRVVLEFWPASLALGAGITLSALILSGALLAWDVHRRVSRQSDNENRLAFANGSLPAKLVRM
jgi:Bacterial membrane protein YfhO